MAICRFFCRADYINTYAHKLQGSGPIPRAIRLGLLAAFALHVINTIALVKENRAARPARYAVERTKRATTASLTMIISGLILLAFILFHIAHFTLGAVPMKDIDAIDPLGRRRAADDDLELPERLGVGVLSHLDGAALHAHHAWLPKRVPTLGLRTRRLAPLLNATSVGLGWLLFLGNAAIVLAILFRFVNSGASPSSVPCSFSRCPPSSPRKKPRSPRRPMACSTARCRPDPWRACWDRYKFDVKLINPANKRKFTVIVVGSGLAGASAAATLAELGYKVKCFCFQDSPRRAHSIAAQGGINAAKNYQNDGDCVYRLFYDTIKGGDFRAREANVYRLAEVSVNIIDQCVAQGVPFAREYGGLLANRSFGGAQVSPHVLRARPDRAAAPARRLSGALPPDRAGGGEDVSAHGDARPGGRRRPRQGHRGARPGHRRDHLPRGDAVVLATGGYGNVFYLSTNAKGCNVTAIWRAHRSGAFFANPCYTQIHPTCIPVSGDYQSKLTLMSESLRNDGRVWVPKRKEDCDKRAPAQIPEDDRDYYLERKYPSYGNLAPRDIASRAAKEACDEGRGVGAGRTGRLSRFRRRHQAPGRARHPRALRQPLRHV